MGLSAPRKRAKLAHDPNNTKWTLDTAGFGHKIMTSQGWQPGEFLGVGNASQAEFYTAANISHIRVVNREDNMGIGMDPKKAREPKSTGLDAFQDLLGRLNGKDEEEILKEQKSRENLKRAIYFESRLGVTRFVRGGFLIGDKIQHLIDAEADRIRILANATPAVFVDASSGDRPNLASELETAPKPTVAKRKKAKKIELVETLEDEAPGVGQESKAMFDVERKSKSEKKRRHEETENGASELVVRTMQETNYAKRKEKKRFKSSVDGEDVTKVKTSKIEKGKLKRKALVGEVAEIDTMKRISERSESKGSKDSTIQEANTQESGMEQSSTPNFQLPAPSTAHSLLGSRHAVRSRNIAQKRLAVLDTAALSQIFMIKR